MNPIVYGAFNIRDRNKVNIFFTSSSRNYFIKYPLSDPMLFQTSVRPTTIETRVTPLSLSLKLLD